MPLILTEKLYRARLWMDEDEWGAASMVKYFKARSLAEATELARHELGLSPQDAARKLSVEEI
jgi:hypothetical protein